MTWMDKTAGGFPLYFDRARGARVTDSTATSTSTSASATPAPWPGTPRPRGRGGHRPLRRRRRGTTMMPTEDAAVVAAELARRFGVALELRPDRDRRQPVGHPAGAGP